MAKRNFDENKKSKARVTLIFIVKKAFLVWYSSDLYCEHAKISPSWWLYLCYGVVFTFACYRYKKKTTFIPKTKNIQNKMRRFDQNITIIRRSLIFRNQFLARKSNGCHKLF